jgi:predicted Fe-S protein YdhL (DUF1289 family)
MTAGAPESDMGEVESGRVPSPCTNVCRLDATTGWCEGCLRTMDEIAAWARIDDATRREIWKRLPGRRRALADARDGT